MNPMNMPTAGTPNLRHLAAKGRYGDTEIAHMTPGEVVVPLPMQNQEVMGTLKRNFDQAGVPMSRYTVARTQQPGQGAPGGMPVAGARRRPRPPMPGTTRPMMSEDYEGGPSINPETGVQEHGLGSFLKKAAGIVLPIAGAAIGGPIGGAIGGAVGAKVSGGNPLIGGLMGGIGGLTAGGFGAGLQSGAGSLPWVQQVAAGTAMANPAVSSMFYQGANFANTAIGRGLADISPFLNNAKRALTAINGGGLATSDTMLPGNDQLSSVYSPDALPTGGTSSSGGGFNFGGTGAPMPADAVATKAAGMAWDEIPESSYAAPSMPAGGYGGGTDLTALPWRQPAASAPGRTWGRSVQPSTQGMAALSGPSSAVNPETGAQMFAAPRVNPKTGVQEFGVSASEFLAGLGGNTMSLGGIGTKGAAANAAQDSFNAMKAYYERALSETGLSLPNSVSFRGGYNTRSGGPYFVEYGSSGYYAPVQAYDDASMYRFFRDYLAPNGGLNADQLKRLDDWYGKTGDFAPVVPTQAPTAAPTPAPTPPTVQANPVINTEQPNTPQGQYNEAAATKAVQMAAKDAGLVQGALNKGYDLTQTIPTGTNEPASPDGGYDESNLQSQLFSMAQDKQKSSAEEALAASDESLGWKPHVLQWLQSNPQTGAQEFFFNGTEKKRGRDMPKYGHCLSGAVAGKKRPNNLPTKVKRSTYG